MYASFRVSNFRCLEDVTVEALARLNLITGKNNVGKTCLLEALFLFYGHSNPALGAAVQAFRGIEQMRTDEFLVDLFHDFSSGSEVTLAATTQQGAQRSLRVAIRSRTESQVPFDQGKRKGNTPEGTPESTSAGLSEVDFEYVGGGGKRSTARAIVGPDAVHYEGAGGKVDEPAVFLTSRQRGNPAVLAERFGTVSVAKELDQVTSLLGIVEPRLRSLSLQLRGGAPLIYGDLGDPRLVPMALMGDGVCRLLEIALAMAEVRHGALLVDEIENGLHHSVMSRIWCGIGRLAETLDVQVFATTHSLECIRSAVEAFPGATSAQLAVHRLEQREEGIRAVSLAGPTLERATELDAEIR